MPVRKLIKNAPSPVAQDLKRRLEDEWRNTASTAAQPVILEERAGTGQPLHLYVIWDEWANLPQVERSEVIMDAFEDLFGQPKSLEVTVAMGLTAPEADRLGIRYR